MDWVKPKHRAKQLQRQEVTENEISAGAWLKQLCEDNVALLQASLPIDNTKKAKRTDASASIESYVRSIAWGTGVWETESDTGLAMLQDLVHSFGGASSRSNRKASTPSLTPNQIAHAKKIGTWITQQLPRAGYDPYIALTCAGWIHALPHVGREISPALWLEVLQSIMTQVNRGWEAGPEPEDGLFPWILWACEIPLGLAKQLSHLGGKDRIVSDALNRIAQLLEEAAEEPAPLMRLGAQDLRATLASIVRSRWAADSVGARKWYPPQRKAITKLTTYALGLSDAEGRQLLFDEADTKLDSEFWLSLYELSDRNTKLANTMACALPDAVGKSLQFKPSRLRKDKTLDASMPKFSQYWEASSIATMRRSWRDPGCRLAVDFSSDVIWLDLLGENGARIFSGDWDVAVEKDGVPQLIDHAWQELCWFSDDDVDYLELECAIGEECKIQRQVMLMRDEGMVFFADALIAQESARWKLQSSWSVAHGLRFTYDAKVTEAKLCRDRMDDSEGESVALLLPVAMPEWRRSVKDASLDCRDDTLLLTAECNAKSLYSPLVMPLRSLTSTKAYTWRQLTIAEELRIQPRDIAEAYRLQINRDQWVFYRSLTPCTRRTVMGLHLNTEFYAGRFCPDDGQFEAIVEVNPDE
ncbi:hypothetical protein SH467x_004279 [Pirellulaceae bacterium SH467]